MINDISFQGDGCRIFKASSSMMTHKLKGLGREEAKELFDEFHQMIVGELDAAGLAAAARVDLGLDDDQAAARHELDESGDETLAQTEAGEENEEKNPGDDRSSPS